MVHLCGAGALARRFQDGSDRLMGELRLRVVKHGLTEIRHRPGFLLAANCHAGEGARATNLPVTYSPGRSGHRLRAIIGFAGVGDGEGQRRG